MERDEDWPIVGKCKCETINSNCRVKCITENYLALEFKGTKKMFPPYLTVSIDLRHHHSHHHLHN